MKGRTSVEGAERPLSERSEDMSLSALERGEGFLFPCSTPETAEIGRLNKAGNIDSGTVPGSTAGRSQDARHQGLVALLCSAPPFPSQLN